MTVGRREISIALPCTGREELDALAAPLESGWLTQGPQVAAFERSFAARHDVKYALATTSCTTALHLALAALGIGLDDEVIVPSFTWVATANAVIYCGAKPVLADVDPATYNIDPADVARKLTSRTRAVIAVHLFGLCADMRALRGVLPASVALIEDAACAAGAAYHGVPAGGLGDVAAFSFHPRKIITTGEGGMLTTNRDDLAAIADELRNHGATVPEQVRHHGPRPYLLPDFDRIGFNYRMTDLQGALGNAQLAKLDRFLAERRRWAHWYTERLADIPWLTMPTVAAGYEHSWQSFVTIVDPKAAPASRNAIMDALHERGVATRPGTHAVHMLGAYRVRFGLGPDDCPAARYCAENTMALPLHNRMSPEDYAFVADALHEMN